MDIGLLGEIDGLETARWIRHSFDIPVTILAVYADDQQLAPARDISPHGSMIKPFGATNCPGLSGARSPEIRDRMCKAGKGQST